jgi:DNA-binding MarR family transcriptional regulator
MDAASRPGSVPTAPSRAIALDRLIHERVRLGIVSALAVHPVLTFSELKSTLQATDGNLSVHARKLEDAGYVSVSRAVEGRSTRTEFRLTPAGRSALRRYLDQLETVLRDARAGLSRPDAP